MSLLGGDKDKLSMESPVGKDYIVKHRRRFQRSRGYFSTRPAKFWFRKRVLSSPWGSLLMVVELKRFKAEETRPWGGVYKVPTLH